MNKLQTCVRHWRYEDGWHKIPEILIDRNGVTTNDRYYDERTVGWYCWIYPSNDVDVEKWLEDNMTGSYDCTFRFNSGDPMYTVFIASDQDATLFKLTWL